MVNVLEDSKGRKYPASKYRDGFDMIIEFEPFGRRIIQYEVRRDENGKKYWHEIAKKEWVYDNNDSIGRYVDGWIEKLS